MTDIAQQAMDSAYVKYGAHKGKNRFEAEGLTGKEIAATLLGNLNYQIVNGGISQWWYNPYGSEVAPGEKGVPIYFAIAALASRFRDLDPDVADSIVEAMTFISEVPDLERQDKSDPLDYYDESEDDDEYFFHGSTTRVQEHFEFETVTDRYCSFSEKRRIGFINKVTKVFPENESPFDAEFEFKKDGKEYVPPKGVKYPDVHVRLVGEDGSAYSIISRTRRAMERARVPAAEIEAYTTEAESGDYDKVIQTTMKWVNYDPPEPETSFKL